MGNSSRGAASRRTPSSVDGQSTVGLRSPLGNLTLGAASGRTPSSEVEQIRSSRALGESITRYSQKTNTFVGSGTKQIFEVPLGDLILGAASRRTSFVGSGTEQFLEVPWAGRILPNLQDLRVSEVVIPHQILHFPRVRQGPLGEPSKLSTFTVAVADFASTGVAYFFYITVGFFFFHPPPVFLAFMIALFYHIELSSQ